ncbi:methyltransferase family protein [Alkalicoccobacillus gibsonii]|uniref:methyltransferase family protein n=1 Tax=Alkalicoccobacillus gibsonii TaxID=79881 RepID=UPI0019314E4D|nr:isoprenylcysteine carboxylmethyltransferase family protein [Alkalicoccobacillus gibsonii]MBM0064847.1 isoprenylcysteine carboxylmethyltransferase family protein [Alkalicoccobacillus gibsonii]
MTTEEWMFLLLNVIWLMEFILFKNPGTKKTSPGQERKSFYYILFSILLTIGICIGIQEWRIVHSPSLFLQWISLFLYGTGIFLRYWSMLVLKQEFTRHVHVSPSKMLVSHGPYHLVRHPLYSGLLLCMIGISFYLAFWIGVAATILLVLQSILYRIKLEEKMLENVLGSQYIHWKTKRWILLPWIY